MTSLVGVKVIDPKYENAFGGHSWHYALKFWKVNIAPYSLRFACKGDRDIIFRVLRGLIAMNRDKISYSSYSPLVYEKEIEVIELDKKCFEIRINFLPCESPKEVINTDTDFDEFSNSPY